MRAPITILVVGLAVAAGLWLLRKPHSLPEPDGQPALTDQASRAPAARADHPVQTNHGASPQGGAEVATGARPSSLAPLPSADWVAVEPLLGQPLHRPLMREVPRLSAESEARLIALFERPGDAGRKQHLVRMLAFGGGSAAVAVLRRTVAEDFNGKRVNGGERILLEYIPVLCGVLARHNDEALAFLLEGSRPEFWLSRAPWEDDAVGKSRVERLVGSCIEGLALSGRSEGEKLVDWYWNHPEETRVRERDGSESTLDGAVVSAAFKIAILRERGIEAAMDEVFYDPETLMRHFDKWVKTPAGQAWYQWALGAERAARMKAGGPPSSSNPADAAPHPPREGTMPNGR